MKTAVCISGKLNTTKFPRNFKLLQENFSGADFYLGTWEGEEQKIKKLTNHEVWLFEQPETHYHPYFDIPTNEMVSKKMQGFANIFRKKPDHHNRTKHGAHQIICHAKMVDRLPKKYDVIVRTRYDIFTYPKASFQQYVQEVFENKQAIGFATLRIKQPTFEIPTELNYNDPPNNKGIVGDDWARKASNLEKFLFDNLIIHHANRFDTKLVYDLFDRKKLCPCEYGWYQVLSEPYNSNHRCVGGWANTDRKIPKRLELK